ncbi:putative bifunctional diguanylate cyclase/phosphodiesterase [Azohydromonas aeria]|uniref:putative bifunctional diguanylate cyclase/phosphodiesterase n=1 Tax=Azohydromonas aeria TaxID=2590212 RepID=UPI0012FCAF59|nr:EAL domain-containing protein [Azohydromonas aeria]
MPGDATRVLLPGSVKDILAPAYRVLWELTIWPALQAAGKLDEVVLELRGDLATVAVLTYWRACPGPHGQTYRVMAVPGTERGRLLARLRQAQDSLDAMPGAILQVRRNGCTVQFPYAGGRLLDLLGVTCHQAMSDPLRVLLSLAPASEQMFQSSLATAEQAGAMSFLIVLQLRREPQRRIELSAQRETPRGPWHCVLTDVSERERLLAELTRRAETDELTLLPNRSRLLAHMAELLQQRRGFAVLYMDCDRFKQVNDSLGHATGDELLRCVARRLRQCLRPQDVMDTEWSSAASGCMAARLGGDEFVVVSDDVSTPAEAAELADRLVQAMSKPYQVGEHEFVLPVSMGVVLATEHSHPEQLLRDSDTAMYEAKRGGRSRWVLFEPAMQECVAASMAMEERLRHALANGHIYPMFQPIVDIGSGRTCGFEALARWHDPVNGHVSPAFFIPVAEDSGLIATLGEQILRRSCATFMAWRKKGLAHGLYLSVNLSRAQLHDPALPRRVQRLLVELAMPHEDLQLEVTESLAMTDDGSLEVLAQLRAMGCRLSLDDFGTGYSSLAALHRLPVQQVKLDRSFISEIGASAYHQAVVMAALQVARALDLEVVAEGVETQSQAQALTALGCTRAQGWLYSKALDADNAAASLRQLPRAS